MNGDNRTDRTICYETSSNEVRHLCKSDKRLAGLIKAYGDLEYTLHNDRFRFLAETIVGQMLSNKVADVIAERLDGLCGGDVSSSRLLSLSREQVRSIGMSRSKADYIFGLADVVREAPDFFDRLEGLPEQEIMSCLTGIRGIGNWSAKMYLIFALDRLDVLPYEDGAFLQAYKWLYRTDDVSPKSIVGRCKAWKPYSSIAARYLYRALDNGMVGGPVPGSAG